MNLRFISALSIQCVFRQHMARCLFKSLTLAHVKHMKLANSAAAIIQCSWRCYLAISMMNQRKLIRAASRCICKSLRRYTKRQHLRQEIASKRLKMTLDAASHINRSFKCYLARKLFNSLKAKRSKFVGINSLEDSLVGRAAVGKVIEMNCTVPWSSFARMIDIDGPSFILTWCVNNHILCFENRVELF